MQQQTLTASPGLEAREVVVAGVAVRYTDNPGPDRGDRLPTVLVHGTGGSTATHFAFIEPMLATRSRVIAIDLSEPEGDDLELDDLVAQVAAVIEDAVPATAVTVLGYSLGAVVAAAFAARHPSVARQLVLVAGWLRTDAQQRLRNEIWTQLAAVSPQALAEYSTFCAFGSPFLHTRTDAQVAELHRVAEPSSFLRKQMQLNRDIDITDEATAIASRALVIGLTEDHMVPRHHSQELFGAIEDARYAELPTGHAVVFERPAQLFALIDEFTGHPDRHPAGSVITPPLP
ncbi:alpha/beta fold hydrolase [Microbacterium thalassium]|uniref:Pimeloyl-ACP methyl ester carboxylesterase n=1 Tax=Microbacterium thalassium TaxID=362649 RepID=A0A7X0FPA5_9MICO|nr:alpha/beta hydrolase [Microbacterium thalassium]MBB6390596.1 pimeloyl-ACP methyl ester carboxylesterase [Microbacterium thalassium]GLK25706.1 alpha/beta hydrolase [Microbacterium thalassium]